MSGKSLPWKMSKKELVVLSAYIRRPVSAALIGGGSCLMLEHLFEYDGFDLLDFWGHEDVGMGMVGLGFLVSMKWGQWDELGLKDWRKWIR